MLHGFLRSPCRRRLTRTLVGTVLLLGLASASAQPGLPGLVTRMGTADSQPPDDAILEQPPQFLDLQFRGRVRLVKLALYTERREWIDIAFRYDPRPAQTFRWPVPPLGPAEYYTAYWAVLDDRQQLIRGMFSFSFGPSAEKPSTVMARNAELLELRNAMPIIEELERLGLDPAEIIINDQNQPRFEPPFAPVLN